MFPFFRRLDPSESGGAIGTTQTPPIRCVLHVTSGQPQPDNSARRGNAAYAGSFRTMSGLGFRFSRGEAPVGGAGRRDGTDRVAPDSVRTGLLV